MSSDGGSAATIAPVALLALYQRLRLARRRCWVFAVGMTAEVGFGTTVRGLLVDLSVKGCVNAPRGAGPAIHSRLAGALALRMLVALASARRSSACRSRKGPAAARGPSRPARACGAPSRTRSPSRNARRFRDSPEIFPQIFSFLKLHARVVRGGVARCRWWFLAPMVDSNPFEFGPGSSVLRLALASQNARMAALQARSKAQDDDYIVGWSQTARICN